jgi:hypothetical protein
LEESFEGESTGSRLTLSYRHLLTPPQQ